MGHGVSEQGLETWLGGHDAPYLPSSVVGSHLTTGDLVISWTPGFPFASTQVDEHGPTTQSPIWQSWIMICGSPGFKFGTFTLLYTVCRMERRPHISRSRDLRSL